MLRQGNLNTKVDCNLHWYIVCFNNSLIVVNHSKIICAFSFSRWTLFLKRKANQCLFWTPTFWLLKATIKTSWKAWQNPLLLPLATDSLRSLLEKAWSWFHAAVPRMETHGRHLSWIMEARLKQEYMREFDPLGASSWQQQLDVEQSRAVSEGVGNLGRSCRPVGGLLFPTLSAELCLRAHWGCGTALCLR